MHRELRHAWWALLKLLPSLLLRKPRISKPGERSQCILDASLCQCLCNLVADVLCLLENCAADDQRKTRREAEACLDSGYRKCQRKHAHTWRARARERAVAEAGTTRRASPSSASAASAASIARARRMRNGSGRSAVAGGGAGSSPTQERWPAWYHAPASWLTCSDI